MKFLATTAFCVILALYRGWILVFLWSWFIIPVTGLKPITTVQGIGLVIVAALFGSISRADMMAIEDMEAHKDSFVLSMTVDYVLPIVVPTIVLVAGWIFQKFL